MPINDFRCPMCGHVISDIRHPADLDEQFIRCPMCKDPVDMQIDWTAHRGNFHLKGPGWTPKFKKKD